MIFGGYCLEVNLLEAIDIGLERDFQVDKFILGVVKFWGIGFNFNQGGNIGESLRKWYSSLESWDVGGGRVGVDGWRGITKEQFESERELGKVVFLVGGYGVGREKR